MNRNSNIAAANDTISIDTIPDSILKPRYECNNKGVFWIGVKTGKDGEVTEAEPLRLADTIKAVGYGIDANNDYYRVIQFRDLSSRQIKTVALSMGEIGSDAFWYRLQILGLFISSEKFKQKKLADYLKNLKEYGSKTLTTSPLRQAGTATPIFCPVAKSCRTSCRTTPATMIPKLSIMAA